MNDALLVGGFQRLGDLACNVLGLTERQRTFRQSIGERRSFDELQYKRTRRPRTLKPVDRTDVGVVQRRQQPGLTLEARHAVGVGREPRRQNFDRDLAAKLRVARAIDLAHATGAQQGHNFIGTDLLTAEIGRLRNP